MQRWWWLPLLLGTLVPSGPSSRIGQLRYIVYDELRIVTIYACMVYTVQWKHMYVHACTVSFSPFSTCIFFHCFSFLFQLPVCYTHFFMNIHLHAHILVNVICNEERRALSMHNELPIVVVQSKERVPSPQLTNSLF